MLYSRSTATSVSLSRNYYLQLSLLSVSLLSISKRHLMSNWIPWARILQTPTCLSSGCPLGLGPINGSPQLAAKVSLLGFWLSPSGFSALSKSQITSW